MTQKALKLALDALEKAYHAMQTDMAQDQIEEAITAIKEALREHAMREVQRLGQEIEHDYRTRYDRGCYKCGSHYCPANCPEPLHLVPQQPEQEPVKWSDYELDGVHHNKPPQRTWVGLTDEEKSELWEISRAALPRYATYASLVEAKLKERNT